MKNLIRKLKATSKFGFPTVLSPEESKYILSMIADDEPIRIENFHIGFEYEELAPDPYRYFNRGFIWQRRVYSFNSPKLFKIQKMIINGTVRKIKTP